MQAIAARRTRGQVHRTVHMLAVGAHEGFGRVLFFIPAAMYAPPHLGFLPLGDVLGDALQFRRGRPQVING